jgi:hypothetical protein
MLPTAISSLHAPMGAPLDDLRLENGPGRWQRQPFPLALCVSGHKLRSRVPVARRLAVRLHDSGRGCQIVGGWP